MSGGSGKNVIGGVNGYKTVSRRQNCSLKCTKGALKISSILHIFLHNAKKSQKHLHFWRNYCTISLAENV